MFNNNFIYFYHYIKNYWYFNYRNNLITTFFESNKVNIYTKYTHIQFKIYTDEGNYTAVWNCQYMKMKESTQFKLKLLF